MNKIILSILVFLSCSVWAFAQQETQFTQFMYNKALLNPAYVGSRGIPTFTGIYRNQWLGFDGAPKSQILNFNTPIFSGKGGLGLGFMHNSIGILNNWQLALAYSYKLKINETSDLRIGVQASLRYLQINFADDKLVFLDTDDPSISLQNETDTNGNFGAGIFYNSKFYYAGISIPNINDNIIGFNGTSSSTTAAESPHIYFMGGGMFYVDKKLHLKPSVLVKYVKNAPIDFDLNLSFVYDYKISAGFSYRYGGVTTNFGESLDLLFFYQATENIGIGAAYDIPLSKIGGLDINGAKNSNAGSIEVLFRYDIINKEKYNQELPSEIEDLRRFL